MNKTARRVLLLSALTFGLQTASAQQCNDNVVKMPPDSRYTNNGNGTVTDSETGLTWMRCSIGQTWESSDDSCSGEISIMTWEGALQIASTSNGNTLFEKTDWRLPNIKALNSLAELACYGPAINETQFPNSASGYYWSSSAEASSSYYAWVVNFNDGGGRTIFRSDFGSVRLVRGGQ